MLRFIEIQRDVPRYPAQTLQTNRD